MSDLCIPFENHAPLGPWTCYGVGGRAQTLARPLDAEQLAALARRCHDEGVSLRVLGSGANLLVADEGVPGVVVRLDAPVFSGVRIEQNRVIAGAGYDLFRLVQWTARRGLGGLACLAGIPASVGGAVRMNAGGSFGDTGRCVSRVRVMDGAGRVRDLMRSDLAFGYRKTNIAELIILEVEFELKPDDSAALRRRVKEVFRYKKSTQPMADHSAGCTFKNPPPPPEGVNEERRPAGMLIDRAGLKGYRVGGARISEQHANFIVCDHDAGCTATDVMAVMRHAEQVVFERFGVRLEREVVVWPG
jgi:UDP-N-acetylmuramate dehydrogenase